MRIRPSDNIQARPRTLAKTEIRDEVDDLPWSSMQSPVKNLTRLPDGSVHLDTVRWGLKEEGLPSEWSGIFGDARLDPRHVKNIYIGVKPFDPELLAAHSVLIFELDENHPVTSSDGKKDSAIVLSMEAKLPQGESYSMKKTLSGKYGVVYQMQTWTDLMQKTGRREGLNQILYKLELDDAQKLALTEKSLEAAAASRSGERYHLFSNSCQSAAIDLVNEVVGEDQQIQRWLLPKIYNPMTLFPAQGDIVFAGHQWLAHQERLIVQPDAVMHPDKLYTEGATQKVLRQMSSSAAWTPACTAVGALGGAMAALSIQQLPALLAVPVAAGLGAKLGHFFAETTERRTQSLFVSNPDALNLSPSQAFQAYRKDDAPAEGAGT